MNHKDLELLIDKIEVDSMCRDEVFYDCGEGVTDRNTKFFNNIRKLQRYFKFYLENEEDIMNRIDEKGEKINPEFTGLVKSVNEYERQKSEVSK